MIITISGKTASGKDTIAKILSKKTGFEVFSVSFKNIIHKNSSEDILNFEKEIKTNKYDLFLDQFIINEVKKRKNKNLIVVSRLSAILLKDISDLKIFLYADEKTRGKRLAKREKIPFSEAIKLINERDQIFENRIKKIYKIEDYSNPKYYDIIINTNIKDPDEVSEIIYKIVKIYI